MKKAISVLLAAVCALSFSACAPESVPAPEAEAGTGGAIKIELSDGGVLVDGETAVTDDTASVYTANDIVFYLEGQGIAYGEGSEKDAHPQSEADAHTVVHIGKPGTYSVSGQLSAGQIAVDLGEDAKDDPAAAVTLILNGADITCTVAPAVIFYRVYECASEEASENVDTSKAGANLVIADGTENNINGAYVAKIYKDCTLDETGTEVTESSKLHKYDGAVYSKMSMNVSGGGTLNINAENEGLDTEMHLTINSGTLNIRSGNDGINTNEDGVSVVTVNGGEVYVNVNGKTGEGDGIDSNGWIVINGGTVKAFACGFSEDSGIDADNGIYVNGGTVIASGNMYDAVEGSANFAGFSFDGKRPGGETYTLKSADGETAWDITPENDFTCLVFASEELCEGDYNLFCGGKSLSAYAGEGGGFFGPGPGEMPEPPDGERPEPPEGFKPPEMPEGEMPGGMRPPEKPDGEAPEDMRPPEMPDGEIPDMRLPEMPRGELSGELSDVFNVNAGGNFFSAVSVEIPEEV